MQSLEQRAKRRQARCVNAVRLGGVVQCINVHGSDSPGAFIVIALFTDSGDLLFCSLLIPAQ